MKVIAQNKRGRFEIAVEETLEAGIVLTGSEVKSLRAGKISLTESYVRIHDGEAFLIKANITSTPTAATRTTNPPADANSSSTAANSTNCR